MLGNIHTRPSVLKVLKLLSLATKRKLLLSYPEIYILLIPIYNPVLRYTTTPHCLCADPCIN